MYICRRFYEVEYLWGLMSPIFYIILIMNFSNKIKVLIDKALEQRPDLFLINFTISESNDIKVVIDGDTGATIEDLVFISRQIEHNLDREQEDFSLTVSSFDITQAFNLKRQFKKNINKQIKVKTLEKEIKGKLIAVNDEKIVLEQKVKEPKKTGKGKQLVIKQINMPFEQIKEAKVVLKF